MIVSPPSALFIRDLYARMLLTRLVDDATWTLYEQGQVDFVARCRGHEAAQVGSAICIEVGQDFTLPYYRDLGVVLTIGMTPLEVFRTYLQAQQGTLQWGYQKHNVVTGSASVATQILHAAGIAFACKLRKAPVVTVAYCGDEATTEADFLEGIRFAAQHQLPVVFVCEHNCAETDDADLDGSALPSCIQSLLPQGLTHQRINGTHVITVYSAMQAAMQQAREGRGPTLLEMCLSRSVSDTTPMHDPLLRCQQMLEERGEWDEEWALQLRARLTSEVEQAMQDAIRSEKREQT